MYVVKLSIWGVCYCSAPMTLDQCEQAQRQAVETHPELTASIESAA